MVQSHHLLLDRVLLDLVTLNLGFRRDYFFLLFVGFYHWITNIYLDLRLSFKYSTRGSGKTKFFQLQYMVKLLFGLCGCDYSLAERIILDKSFWCFFILKYFYFPIQYTIIALINYTNILLL